MTAHELAKKLLEMPDEVVSFWEYTGAGEDLREIKSVEVDADTKEIVLYSYVKE